MEHFRGVNGYSDAHGLNSLVNRIPGTSRERGHQSQDPGPSHRNGESPSVVSDFLVCPHCGCRYKGKSSFTTHLRKKHPDAQKDIICHVCNTQMDERIFERHFREHRELEMKESQSSHRLLKCDFCDFSCSLDVDMIQHTGIDHEGNNVFSIARTQAQFLTKTRNSKRKLSENESEKTLSECEAPEPEYEEVLEETVVNMDGTMMTENDPRAEILLCLKRGRAELLENGFAEVMLHHLLISTYERSWIKLLVATTSKHIRLPIEVSALPRDENLLTNFVIENEIPPSLKKLFLPDAWSHLEALIRSKRSLYHCFLCRLVQNSKMIQCATCRRRYHQSCCSKAAASQAASTYSCTGCYL